MTHGLLNPGQGAVYPRMMYRPGTEAIIHDCEVDTAIAENEDQEIALMTEGWGIAPTGAQQEIPVRRGPGRPPKLSE